MKVKIQLKTARRRRGQLGSRARKRVGQARKRAAGLFRR